MMPTSTRPDNSKKEKSRTREDGRSKSAGPASTPDERQVLNKALSRCESRYAALFRRTHDCVAVYQAVDGGEDFIIRDFNPAAEAVEKCRREEILGRKVTEVFPGIIRFGLLDVFRRVWRTGRTERFPLHLYQDDRIRGWRDNVIYKLPSGEVVALYRDETERKKFEEAIKNSNNALLMAQQMARLGHWHYDAKTRMINWSDQMYTLLGRDPALGVPNLTEQNQMVHPEDRKLAGDAMRRALSPGESSEIMIRMFRPDQSIRWFSTQCHPQHNEAGDIVGLNGILLDITEIKEAEQAREILESQLRRAQKMEAIGTITGGIAHDFNNILGIIMGNAELAKDNVPKGSEESRNLDEILQASARAKQIIRQLMSFGRSSPAQLVPLDLGALLAESLGFIRSVAPSSIRIRQDITPEPAIILADAGQIHQLLLNLCTNAVHAMEPEGGTLEAAVMPVRIDADPAGEPASVAAGDYICLGIRDTGHGIDPQCLERIFDPYFTTKEVGKGSGLGLAVVHGIVQKHRAAITVESEKNRGSYFAVYFPRFTTSQEPTGEELHHSEAQGCGSILLVDDEPSLTKSNCSLLQRMGYLVTTASSGDQALAALEESPLLDLVISDMTMPGMSGERLVEKIKMIRPDLPILLCTGFSERMNLEKARALGVHYAEKPLDRAKLGQLVRRILASKTKAKPDAGDPAAT